MTNNSNLISYNVVIVIPVYKKFQLLERAELKLFEQIKTVFKKREVSIILPKSLEKDWEKNSVFNIISFDDAYFKGKLSYSKLLCHKQFYESFSDFDFIQIIQTDCWVFEDKLDYFSNLSVDYIGAPWMIGGFEGKPQKQMWKVGNGGFSLRKTETFLNILDLIKDCPEGKQPVFKFRKKGFIDFFKNKGYRNNLKHYIKEAPGEDIFWSIYVPHVFKNLKFKIADLSTAAHYSFEVLPEFLFNEITRGRLPMGCHNWMNNNPDFWKNYIKY